MIEQPISRRTALDRLGEGGIVVYKAEDTKLKWIVALEGLPARLLGSEDIGERFGGRH